MAFQKKGANKDMDPPNKQKKALEKEEDLWEDEEEEDDWEDDEDYDDDDD